MHLRTTAMLVASVLLVAARSGGDDAPAALVQRLANGVQVVVQPVPDAAFVHVDVFYAAGSSCDPPGREGLAHLVEHLLFTSSGDHPDGGLARTLALQAVTSNAATSHLSLRTETVCLPRHLRDILALEADRLADLAPLAQEFERERSVVLTELALRTRTTPSWDLRDAVFEAAYAGSAVAHSVGGDATALAAATPDDVDAFRRRWLRPDNAVVVIAGAVESTAALALVAETLGRVASGDDAAPAELLGTDAVSAPDTSIAIDRYDSDGFHVCLGFRLPQASVDERPGIWCIREALRRQGLVTSLQPLRTELFLTAEVWYRFPSADDGVPSVESARSAAQDGLADVWRRVDRARKQLRGGEGFDAIRQSLRRDIARTARDPGVVAVTQGEQVLAGWPPFDYAAMGEAVAVMQPQTVLAVFDRDIIPGKAVVGVLYGRDSGRAARVALPAHADDAVAPEAPDPLASVGAAQITAVLEAYAADLRLSVASRALANGIPVSVLTIPGSGRVWLSGVVQIPWLASERRGELRGLVQLYDAVVNEGYRSPEVGSDGRYIPFEPPFDAFVFATPWSLEFAADGLATRLPDIGRSLVERLEDDRFNHAAWAGALGEAEGMFALENNEPGCVATTYRWSAHFGDDHPVTGLWCGDEAAVAKMRYKDLQKLHREVARGRDTRLLAVGDVDPDTLTTALAASFGRRRPFEDLPTLVLPPREPGVKGRIVPAFDQRDISLMVTFPPAAAQPSATGLELALLADLVQARLYGRLRSVMGRAYFVSVAANPLGGQVVFEAVTSSRPEAAPAVLAAIRAELRALAETGPTDVEIARARLVVVRRLAGSLMDPETAAPFMCELAEAGPLPPEPLPAVNAITAARVRALLAVHLPADDFAFTAVGPVFEEDLPSYLRP